jgi:hypothetical protein
MGLALTSGAAVPVPPPFRNRFNPTPFIGGSMAKGDQRTEKLAKKPKKDTSAPKAPVASDRPMAPMTSVLPKGKLKNKPA